MPDKITSSYLHQLQAIYYNLGERGIVIDYDRIQRAKIKVVSLIEEQLKIASDQWGCRVYIGAENKVKGDINSVNLNSTAGEASLLAMLKNLKYEVPLISKKNIEGEYESKYSTGELALQKMLTLNQFGFPDGDPAIRAILRVRELGKLDSAYLNARLSKRGDYYLFLSSYNVAGTLTGRRSSKKHAFNFGNNGQNFPSHSDIAAIFRSCLVSRAGNILVSVDQIQAEDWPVSALSNNTGALYELRTGIDRHSKLATSIFAERIPAKTDSDWNKDKHERKRYLGKKGRHASNYGMGAQRFSDALAQEGITMSKQAAQDLLNKIALADPSVKGVFHQYVKTCLETDLMLRTPFGRERMFLNARPNADNYTVFNEAFSYIPQSTVGDNTGFAVYYLETTEKIAGVEIIQEGHDSIVQDVPDDEFSILHTIERTAKAFDRTIRFHNGIEVNIPVEAEIGYDFDLKVSLKTLDLKGIREAKEKLLIKKEKRDKEYADEMKTVVVI